MPPQPPLTSVMYALSTGNVAAAKKSDTVDPHGLVAQLVIDLGQILARGRDAGHRAAGFHDDLTILDLDVSRPREVGLLPAVETLAVEEDELPGPAGRLVLRGLARTRAMR